MGAETSAGRYTPAAPKRATPYEQQQAARVAALSRASAATRTNPAITPAASRTPAPAPAARPAGVNSRGNYAQVSTPQAVAPGPIAPGPAPVSTNPADYESRVDAESTYAAQETGWQKALADYIANQGLASSQYNTNYDGSKFRQLGLDEETGKASLLEDYAARGLGSSGAYLEAADKQRNEFATQRTGLGTAKTQFGETRGSGTRFL